MKRKKRSQSKWYQDSDKDGIINHFDVNPNKKAKWGKWIPKPKGYK